MISWAASFLCGDWWNQRTTGVIIINFTLNFCCMSKAYFARSYRKVSRCFQSMSELQRFLCNLFRMLGCNVSISANAWPAEYRTCLIFLCWLPWEMWLWMLAYVLICINQSTYLACRSIPVFCWGHKDHGVDSHRMSPKLIRIFMTVFV